MRRFVSFGPSFVVLLALGAVLVGAPALMMRLSAHRTRERVDLARNELGAMRGLDELNRATRLVAEIVEPSVVHLEVGLTRFRGSTGSGWVYDSDGHIVTNAHVVGPAKTVGVQFFDGRVERATVVGADALADVAVLKVPKGEYLVPAKRASGDRVFRGDRVFAFGSPFNFRFSMSEGIVSGLGRNARAGAGSAGITNFIQTDAAVNPGNSGGPLVDVNGRVVGMNVAIATAENSQGGTEGQSAGISFAIPLGTIESRVEQIIAGGRPRSGYMGVSLADEPVVYGEGGFQGVGVAVMQVVSGGPAEEAGLRPGDIVTRIDGEDVRENEAFISAVGARRPGSTLVLSVVREGKPMEIRVRVTGMPDEVLAGRYRQMLVDRFGVALGERGGRVIVLAVAERSVAEEAGLRAGLVITRVNDVEVTGFEQALLAMSDAGLFLGSSVSLTLASRAEEEGVRRVELRLPMR